MAHNGVMTFTLDSSSHHYPAVSYGARWNGWATPVVTRETFVQLISDENGSDLSFDVNGIATLVMADDYESLVISPDASGNYDLDVLGWTFSLSNEGQ